MNGKKLKLRARRKLSWNERRKLVQHDWDFSDCPLSELPTCFRYEYCRESKMRKAVQELRQRLRSARSEVRALKIAKKIGEANMVCLSFDFFACIPDFPEIPWLDLDKKLRDGYRADIRSMANKGESVLGMKMILDVEKQGLGLLRLGTVCGRLAIPPGFTKAQIVKQFERQLARISEANPKLFSKKSGGRDGAKAALKQLGACRLLCGRSAGEAAILVKGRKRRNGKTCYLYSKDNAWHRAKDGAFARIEEFDKVAAHFLSCFQSLK